MVGRRAAPRPEAQEGLTARLAGFGPVDAAEARALVGQIEVADPAVRRALDDALSPTREVVGREVEVWPAGLFDAPA